MAYTLNPAKDVMEIEECQYGCAAEVKFSKFTSCIGILAKKKGEDKVIGIHLVMINKHDEPFDKAAAATVMACLTSQNYDAGDVVLFGRLETWSSDPRTKEGYAELLAKLNPTKDPYQFGDGIYGGKIENGEVEITY